MSKKRYNDRIDELLDVTYDNNRMLKYIVKCINAHMYNAENENTNDFMRNVIANLISGRISLNRQLIIY